MQIEIDDMVNIADWFTFHHCAQVEAGKVSTRVYFGYFLPQKKTPRDIIEISRFFSYLEHLLRIDLTPFRWFSLTCQYRHLLHRVIYIDRWLFLI